MDGFEKIKKEIDECERKIDNGTKIKDWVTKEWLQLIRRRARRKFGSLEPIKCEPDGRPQNR